MKLKSHILAFVLALFCFYGATSVWDKMASVVWLEKAVALTLDEQGALPYSPDTYLARVSGYKVRDCIYIEDSELGYVKSKDNGQTTIYEAGFRFVNDPTPNSNRPTSWWYRQDFGLWEWTDLEHPSNVTHVLATVGHDCGDGNIRTTVLGPFALPLPKDYNH